MVSRSSKSDDGLFFSAILQRNHELQEVEDSMGHRKRNLRMKFTTRTAYILNTINTGEGGAG